MTKELKDLAWAVLPKEFKEEVKKYYQHTDCGSYAEDILESIFGENNLTSDAEGEEMLTISRKELQKYYADVEIDITDYQGGGKLGLSVADPTLCERAKGMRMMLRRLFGAKCLPDEEPKPAEPTAPDCTKKSDGSQTVADCHHFDNILSDSFHGHNRLHIAAMAMQGIMSNPKIAEWNEIVSAKAHPKIIKASLRYADALIAECGNGGSDD